jgi:CDP-diacylglycerol--serine O-phosphatidyltransferase
MLNAYSELGKQLDSLADMISFGFAPAVIAMQLVKTNIAPQNDILDLPFGLKLMVLFPFVITVFSALRLAKFNIDTRQTDSFIGLPTPANAMIWASMPFILAFQGDTFFANIFSNSYVLLALSLLMSLALVMEMPLFSLKFKNFSLADNKLRFIFLAICVLLIAFFGFSSIPLIIICYILLSLKK